MDLSPETTLPLSPASASSPPTIEVRISVDKVRSNNRGDAFVEIRGQTDNEHAHHWHHIFSGERRIRAGDLLDIPRPNPQPCSWRREAERSVGGYGGPDFF